MHSIRTRILVVSISVIIITMIIAAVFGVVAIRNINTYSSEQILRLLCEAAQKNLEEKTFTARTHEEFLDIAQNKPGFIKAMWCGDTACEDQLKDETGGVKSRCIPFVEEQLSDKCVCCGKPAKHMVFWGRQY